MSFFFFSNSSCLEHLLDNGADPSMVNSKGYSAVHYAAYHGNKQNLELVCFLSEWSFIEWIEYHVLTIWLIFNLFINLMYFLFLAPGDVF